MVGDMEGKLGKLRGEIRVGARERGARGEESSKEEWSEEKDWEDLDGEEVSSAGAKKYPVREAARKSGFGGKGDHDFPSYWEVRDEVAQLAVVSPFTSSSSGRRPNDVQGTRVNLADLIFSSSFATSRNLLIRTYAAAQQAHFRLSISSPDSRRKSAVLVCGRSRVESVVGCPFALRIVQEGGHWRLVDSGNHHSHALDDYYITSDCGDSETGEEASALGEDQLQHIRADGLQDEIHALREVRVFPSPAEDSRA